MIYYVLIIIGMMLVIISILIIIKQMRSEKKEYIKILDLYNKMEEESISLNKILENMEDLINSTLIKMSDNDIEYAQKNNDLLEVYKTSTQEESEVNYKNEIIKLKQIGLSNQQIAQKLKKGIREIDIILKMKENNI